MMILRMPFLLSLLILAWVALQRDFSLATWCLGALVAVLLLAWLGAALKEPKRPRSVGTLLKLTLVVLWDILRANIDVAGRVLSLRVPLESRFLWVPVDAQSDEAIALLASIITLTPGTLSAELSPDRHWLLVHALHAPDPEQVVLDIKTRYEAPLVRLFDPC